MPETPSILYLCRADVERACPDMSTVIQLLERAFREKAEGRVEMPPKPGIHTRPDSFIHAMPAYIPGMDAAGIKWVSGYPGNQAKGLPYISGLLVLNDVSTGIPYAVMDCTWITAVRTGAATALAAKNLARAQSETVAVLACGVQGRTNLRALAATARPPAPVQAPTMVACAVLICSRAGAEPTNLARRRRYATDSRWTSSRLRAGGMTDALLPPYRIQSARRCKSARQLRARPRLLEGRTREGGVGD